MTWLFDGLNLSSMGLLADQHQMLIKWDLVNISPVQLIQTDFVEKVKMTMEEFELTPSIIQLEITETAPILEFRQIMGNLIELRKLGFKIHLDDFGIGYSSLAYLKNLPVDVVKIDKSFIDDIQHHPLEKPILESIVQLLNNINLKVTVEGVENLEEIQFLSNIQCHYLQGYYFSKPKPEEEIFNMELVNLIYQF